MQFSSWNPCHTPPTKWLFHSLLFVQIYGPFSFGNIRIEICWHCLAQPTAVYIRHSRVHLFRNVLLWSVKTRLISDGALSLGEANAKRKRKSSENTFLRRLKVVENYRRRIDIDKYMYLLKMQLHTCYPRRRLTHTRRPRTLMDLHTMRVQEAEVCSCYLSCEENGRKIIWKWKLQRV